MRSPLSTWKVAKYRVEAVVCSSSPLRWEEKLWRLATTAASTVSRGEWLFLFRWDSSRTNVTRIMPRIATKATMKSRKKMEMNPSPEKKLSNMARASFFRGMPRLYGPIVRPAGDKIHQPQVAPGHFPGKRQETSGCGGIFIQYSIRAGPLASQRSGAGVIRRFSEGPAGSRCPDSRR